MNHSILIVDDDEDDLYLLENCIRQHQQDVTFTFAGNGVEAIKKLADSLQPNLIIVDTYMPLMNGYELLVWLMASPSYRRIPIVIWTGEIAESEVTPYYQAGADSVMLKHNLLLGAEAFCKHWFGTFQLPLPATEAPE